MLRAAGVMFLTAANETLFLKRSDTSDHPGEWCFPGGGVEGDETAQRAAEREVGEEIGQVPHGPLLPLTRQIRGSPQEYASIDFTTFMSRVNERFVPKLNDEHSAWAWAPINQPPEPLHPGCRVALARPGMDELDVARAMVAGELISPQKYGTFWLFCIRLTATGLSYRSAHDEYVWRDKSLYLTDDFLARANGTPVIFEHPEKKPKLDSDEFNERIVGVTFLPFIRGDDVWAVTKIYDEPTANWMLSKPISTSSGVVFGKSSGNQKIKDDDGRTLLIEGKPQVWDHIAIVANGVWDKGGPPTGVQNDILSSEVEMPPEETADEKKAREDKARKDAEFMDRLDGFMKRTDARMDAMEMDAKARKDGEDEKERADATEREDRARKDAARKDRFGARKDGESHKDWKSRHDADEAAMCDAFEKGGVEKDKARKDARDCRMDAEASERKDGGESFEKWAKEEKEEPEHKDDAAKKDADEKAEKEREEKEREDARKDASVSKENADLRRQMAAMQVVLNTLTTEVPATERDALANAQSRADSVSAMFGERAPQPFSGELSVDYRKRILKKFQAHSAKYKESRFDSADAATLDLVEDVIYNDAVVAAKAPALARPGILMPIEKRDAAGRTITTYVGDPIAWMAPYMTNGQSGKIARNPNAPN